MTSSAQVRTESPHGDGCPEPSPCSKPRSPAPDRRPAVLGVRPEQLSVDPRGDLGLYVELVEPLGAETLLHSKLDGGDTTLTVRVAGTPRIRPEDCVKLRVAPGQLHLFDPDSGVRLE